MYVLRSPTCSSLNMISAAAVTVTRIGGSQPDLSEMNILNHDTDNITLRKRLKPDSDCSCSEDIREMRSEMSRISVLLEKYVGSNEQILQNMQDSITEIKTQIMI